MELFENSEALPSPFRGGAIAVGNFDGVHPGHAQLIRTAVDHARAASKPAGVLTFEPHPKALFKPDAPPFRLTPWPAKRRLLAELGLDFTVKLAFDRGLASRTAEEFIDATLVDQVGVSHVVVGYDFCFGRGRAGTGETLIAAGAAKGFGVTRVAAVKGADGEVYSSSRIRHLIAAGEVRDAARLLGRPFEIEATVESGDRLGRKLGFPTANLRLGETLRPAFGIYAAQAMIDARWRDSVVSLGIRPTVADRGVLLEVHVFDFSGDLYGKSLRVRLIDYLRPEARFPDLESLRRQIAEDCRVARARLALAAAS
ncbi:MAG: bifunctional riboflavin kinase/FAD synthetase [Alphaproteobacteria bacterium]|nr:bifunctional riboflavin kinase/FAD synthetase [Alphaproteobacteria bacterium]